jgi:hypothetical protein
LRLGGFARNSISQSVDNTGDAVLDQRHVEIDEQAEAFVGHPEIGQKLLLEDWGYQLDGFDFNDDLVFDHQIGPESGVDDLLGYGVFVQISFHQFLAKSQRRTGTQRRYPS